MSLFKAVMTVTAEIKRTFFEALSQLAEAPPQSLSETLLSGIAHDDADWRAAHPMNEMTGNRMALSRIWTPLKKALPDLERRDLIFVGGAYEGRSYIAAVGHYCGLFQQDWLGIPATGQPLHVRYGEIYQIEDGRIVQANLLWDILDVIRQSGVWPLPPSRGSEGLWYGPNTGDGIILHDTDPVLSETLLRQTLAMHKTLFDYDNEHPTREGLINMEQRRHWHPKMMWYGPSGIGTTRGLVGFVDGHQLPFRIAFQRPKGTLEDVEAVRKEHHARHYIRIGDGDYSVTGGWPSFPAIHYGPGFMGQEPTNKLITMRVMDFYHHHEGLIRENWVPIDILDVLRQLGLDVLDALRRQRQSKGI